MTYFILVSYFLTAAILSLFSYTQVDSPLIDFGSDKLAAFIKIMQDFGANNRFATGSIFTLLLTLFFIEYFCFLINARHLSKRFILTIIIGSVLVTAPAFPAFLSHDIYSYIFDAKILAFYRQLPWFASPSHFASDPWLPLDFWPTSSSRYGPIWALLTSFLYQLGGGNLIRIMFIFKSIATFSFLGSAALIWKLAKKLRIDSKTAVIFFAANPLIVIDGLVNLHTDLFMSFFILLGLYFFLSKRELMGYIALTVASLGIKIVSAPLLILPILTRGTFLSSARRIVVASLALGYLGSIIIIARWSINPWYLLLPIVLSSLVWEIKFWRFLAISLSAAALVRYLPYLYWGFFDPNNKIRAVLFTLFMVPFGFWVLKNLFTKPRRWWFEEIFGSA